MASIQQSLNQLLGAAAGAATAGSYMIRQSAGYQAKQEANRLENRAERLQQYSEGIDVEDLGEAYGKSRELQIEAAMIDPKKMVPSHDDPSKKVTRAERAHQLLGEIAAENRAANKAKAESEAVSRLETRSMTAREMLTALQERKDLLSAKERGQLGTMAGRHKDKGGMDE